MENMNEKHVENNMTEKCSTNKLYAVLSIDPGEVNLGWTLIVNNKSFKTNKEVDVEDLSLKFNVFNFKCLLDKLSKKYNSKVIARCKILKDFINQFTDKFIIEYFIVEQQVGTTNTKCMEIMSILCSLIMNYIDDPEDIIVFKPQNKFTKLGIEYDSRNKAHKRLSINMCRATLMEITNNDLIELFDKHPKQDDVADSFNQAILWLTENNKIYLSLSDIRSFIKPFLK